MKKNKNGITLIALVITIIVLLILAGISISMLSGDNSILQKSTDAESKTRRTQIIECTKIDILGEMAENKGANITKEQLARILNNYFKPIESTSIPDAISSVNDIVLTTLDEKYEIYLSEIFDGNFAKKDVETGLQIPIELKTAVENGEIKVVKMETEGEYTWDAKYYTDTEGEKTIKLFTGTPKSELTNTDYNMSITEWKVLKINDNTMDLIPANETTKKLPLGRAQGYNNGVRLLNEACSNLYGDIEHGITARSIKIEDIEELLNETAIETAKNNTNPKYGKTYQNAFTEYGTNYRNANGEFIRCKTYPSIYQEELGSTINGITNESGLELSQYSNRWYLRTNYENVVTNATSIKPKMTSYSMNNSVLINALGIRNTSLLLPNGSSTNYWIASRNIKCMDWGCWFSIDCIYNGGFNSWDMFTSNYVSDQRTLSIFPIVHISAGLLTQNQDGTYSYSTT